MLSLLQKKRLEYQPVVPKILKDLNRVCFEPIQSNKMPEQKLKELFPKTFDSPTYQLKEGRAAKREVRIGVVFSGGPAPGGHNVIAGLFDTGAKVVGFLNGPSGIVKDHSVEITDISQYRNQGGFHLIGTGRTKIESEEQLQSALKTVNAHKLDGLVVIGGDDSNTNAAVMAEYFLSHGAKTCVVGVPKTIDADLRSEDIELSFGFDSASKTYAELIGNISSDALSSRKYYHFIKLMGRAASHITLECALLTQPNLALISEEKKSFDAITEEICSLIMRRFEAGKQYGVILVPEGLIESVPEFDALIEDLPVEKDPHGNVELSKIESEKLLIDRVKKSLKERNFSGKFNPLAHSFGYEGRSCMPTNFDANYCYTLGRLAFLAVKENLTGMICSVQGLKECPLHWEVKLVPIVNLMHIENRLGKNKPVIKKTLVDINGNAFVNFTRLRKAWEIEDRFQAPGPIQYFGGSEIADSTPLILN